MRQNRYRSKKSESKVFKTGIAQKFRRLVPGVMVLGMVCLTGIFFILLHDGITQLDYFSLKQVTVLGLERLSKDEVLTRAGVQQGDNSLSVNLSLVKKRLVSHDWILDASVKREIPSTLLIAIKEEKPIAMARIGKEKDLWVNTQGQPFKVYDSETDTVDIAMPLIKGLELEKTDGSYGFSGALHGCIMQILHIKGLDRVRTLTADMDIGVEMEFQPSTEVHPDSSNPIRVKLGFDHYGTKVKMVKMIAAYMGKNAPQKRLYTIDLFNRDSATVKVDNNDTLPDSIKGGV